MRVLFSQTGVAQLVEWRSPKPQAGSSSLSTRAEKKQHEQDHRIYQ